MKRSEMIERLNKIAAFLQGRADMAIGDAKMVLTSWWKGADEAAALLTRTKPRVMTLGEVISIEARDEPLFLDVKGGSYYEWVYWYRCPDDYVYLGWWHGDGEAWECTMPVDEYGVTWRCWTSKPTDEEREAAEWLR